MPDIDLAEHAVLAIAAVDWNEQKTANWLRHLIAARPGWLLIMLAEHHDALP